MKPIIYKVSALFVLVTLLLFLTSNTLSAQNRIYGNANHLLCYFDYSSGQYTTLQEYYLPFPNTSSGCTIDPFNGRYFYKTAPTDQYSSITTVLLDSIGEDISPAFEFPDLLEYNCLNNTLMFQTKDGSFWSYDIELKKAIKLSTLLPRSGIISGKSRVYSPITNQYFNQRYYNGNIYLDVIDGINGEMISSHISPFEYIGSVVVDYNTGNYYGIMNDSVVKFNPLTDEITPIVKLPIPFVHLNNQMAVFDQKSAKYIIPLFVNNENKAYYIVVDVIYSNVDTVIPQPNMYVDWQQIYSKPSPLILQLGDSLICSYGKSYLWFYNGDTIFNCTSNVLKPKKSGYYKVEVRFSDYTNITNEIFYNYLGTTEKLTETFKVFPNPVHDKLKIQYINNHFAGIYFEIIDIQGNVIIRRKHLQKDMIINTSFLKNGVYIVKLTTQEKTTEKKFVKF